MSPDETWSSKGLTSTQESSLRELGAALILRNRGWLFAELIEGSYRECDYLKRETEGAVVLKIRPRATLVLPPTFYSHQERRERVGGPALRPGETGWIGTSSNRFRVREAIVDEDQGVEYAIGYMESGGFHISKLNFDHRFRSDSV
jgi:hypothetical protein